MTTGPDQFECQCVEGYEGNRCELMVTDECDPDPCQNGGTCTVRRSVFLLLQLNSHACISFYFQDLFLDYFECQCVAGVRGEDTVVWMNQTSVNQILVRMEGHAK